MIHQQFYSNLKQLVQFHVRKIPGAHDSGPFLTKNEIMIMVKQILKEEFGLEQRKTQSPRQAKVSEQDCQ